MLLFQLGHIKLVRAYLLFDEAYIGRLQLLLLLFFLFLFNLLHHF